MPKPLYFERIPHTPEETTRQLEMARPRRGELEMPELTKEENSGGLTSADSEILGHYP